MGDLTLEKDCKKDTEDKIVLYPSNWLYNAGVIGLLRVLEFGSKGNAFIFSDDGSVSIIPSSFNNFEIYYFEYVSKLYLLQKINLRDIATRVNDSKIKTGLIDLEQRLQEKINNLKPNQDMEYFFSDIESILEEKQLEKEFSILNIDPKNKNEKLKNFREIYVSVTKFKGQADHLGAFYFNKGIVANPKGKRPERPRSFKEKYLKSILTQRDGDDFCVMCGNRCSSESMSELAQGDFSILGISKEKFFNFYNYFSKDGVSYNKKCSLCQLILLCAFAGFNYKPYPLREMDETDYIFINYPSFEDAFRVNNRLNEEFKHYQYGTFTDGRINTYLKSMELILAIVKKKSKWLLQNTYFCEIKVSTRKDQLKPKFVYFNIDKSFAEVFEEFSIDAFLKKLSFRLEIYKNNYIFLSTEVLKRLLEKKPLIYIAFRIIQDKIEAKDTNFSSVESLIFLEFLMNQKRRFDMSAKTSYGILKGIEEAGKTSFTLKEIEQEKRFHVSQRFLTLIRGARKEDFYNELLRLFVVYRKQVPENLFSLLIESDEITFQEKALAFLTGFINPKIQDKEEGENE